jgi:hypothetical protein
VWGLTSPNPYGITPRNPLKNAATKQGLREIFKNAAVRKTIETKDAASETKIRQQYRSYFCFFIGKEM